jgi:hypothetical protein
MKSITNVLIEAVIVGIGLIAIVRMVSYFKLNNEMLTLFVSGVTFHIICEYTGVNEWYARDYCKLLGTM